MQQFQFKIAIITGAAQGIGAAIASNLAEQGADVVLIDRQDCTTTLKQIQTKLSPTQRIFQIQLDVGDTKQVNTAITKIEAEFGPIAILINAAAILRLSPALTCSDDDWCDTININLGGVFRLCRAVGQHMQARRAGVIISVASNAAHTARQNMAAYAASKAGITQFMRCLGLELAPYGIRCNTVSPGSTDTAMQRQLWTSPTAEEAIIKGDLNSFRLGIPLGRIASAQDIADAVCFLASQQARHITMQDLCVDGGATLGV